MPALVFIDTNILLDFYRRRGAESDLAILKHIDANHARIITTTQVEMEFKKNRPAAILETFSDLRSGGWKGLGGSPAFLAKSKQSKALKASGKRIDDLLSTLQKRTKRVFAKPTVYDPIYKVAQRLFRDETPLNLSRKKDVRFRLRRLAAKRFLLGYPPRKASDTSIGDALNWEWLVQCAIDNTSDIVIVSRDGDYGARFHDELFLNDWLHQEFRDRVGTKRSVTLTDRLAEGFKAAGIKVTQAEDQAEQEFLEEQRTTTIKVPTFNLGLGVGPGSAIERAFLDMQKAALASGQQFRGLLSQLKIPAAPTPEDPES